MVSTGCVTVKFVLLDAVCAPTVTAMDPVVAPDGTVTVSDVAVEDETIAPTPLNVTAFAEGVVLKFVPVMVTVLPTTPLDGETLVMVGGGSVTVKLVLLIAWTLLSVTRMGPVIAELGTLPISLTDETYVTDVARKLWKVIVAAEVKPFPLIVTDVPTGPLAGLKLVMFSA